MSGPGGPVLRLDELSSLPAEDRLEACRQFIERATEAIGAAQGRSATASDPAGLATATVSGTGSVEDVRLAQDAVLADREELEHAVRVAVSAARTELMTGMTGALEAIRVESGGTAGAEVSGAALLADVRDELAGRRYEKSSADDEVLVAVDRDGELSHIRLAPVALRHLDRHTLGELITAAIRDAQAQAAEALAEAVRRAWPQTSNSPVQGLGSNTIPPSR